MSERFQGSKRPLEGGQEEERPRKQWRGAPWMGPAFVSQSVPLEPKSVVEPKPESHPYLNSMDEEGVTQPEVNPIQAEEEMQMEEEEEEFWVPGTSTAYPVSQDFDWQSKDLEGDSDEELLDYEDCEFWDTQIEQPQTIDLDEPLITDWNDSDSRSCFWWGKRREQRNLPSTRGWQLSSSFLRTAECLPDPQAQLSIYTTGPELALIFRSCFLLTDHSTAKRTRSRTAWCLLVPQAKLNVSRA